MRFRNWRDMVNAGKWRKKARRPAYHHVLLRNALRKEGLTFQEFVVFYNDYNQLQYLDFVISRKGGPVVILWEAGYPKRREGRWKRAWGTSGLKKYEKVNRDRKREFLDKRGIPYMVASKKITKDASSDSWRIKVRRWLHTLDKIRQG